MGQAMGITQMPPRPGLSLSLVFQSDAVAAFGDTNVKVTCATNAGCCCMAGPTSQLGENAIKIGGFLRQSTCCGHDDWDE